MERIAAHRRLFAEVLASEKEQQQYHERTRDHSQAELDAIREQIASLVGPDRDQVHGLDEEGAERYRKLAGMERDAMTRNAAAREILDRLSLSYDGEKEDE